MFLILIFPQIQLLEEIKRADLDREDQAENMAVEDRESIMNLNAAGRMKAKRKSGSMGALSGAGDSLCVSIDSQLIDRNLPLRSLTLSFFLWADTWSTLLDRDNGMRCSKIDLPGGRCSLYLIDNRAQCSQTLKAVSRPSCGILLKITDLSIKP